MRILFDHQAFSLQVTGGITRYFYELIRHLNSSPDISTFTQVGFCKTIWPLDEASKPHGRTLHWGPRLINSGVGTYFINEALLGCYNLTQPRIDIYHNTLYRFMPSIRAKAYVATHNDCTIERFPHLFTEAAIVIRAKKAMLKKADFVFCITNSCREDLHYFYDYDRSRTMTLTYGAAALSRSSEAETELKQMVKRPFILYVGTRFAYKNFSGLLKAYAASGLQEDYDLLAIGGGVLSASEKLEISSLGLDPFVLSVPLASGGFLAEAYAAASVFVYPSLYEGLGIPPLEAMEKGCRVLASSNPACVEVCRDAALFFDPLDEADFVRKLLSLVQDTEDNKRRVMRGYEVCKLYSWSSVVEKMIRVYRSLLSAS
jgi:glycosyltransferase involved in cell wall biosynthesis